jgi:HSP20 family protein
MATYRTWSFGPMNFTALAPETASHQTEDRPLLSAQHLIPVRLSESDTGWTVEADIPGIDPASVSMEFFQNKLTISYQRHPDESAKTAYDNRLYGDFQRIIKVSDDVKADGINATTSHGVLRIFLPKSETSQPRRIVVNQQ